MAVAVIATVVEIEQYVLVAAGAVVFAATAIEQAGPVVLAIVVTAPAMAVAAVTMAVAETAAEAVAAALLVDR